MVRKQQNTLPNIKLSHDADSIDLSLKNSKQYRKENKIEIPWTKEETDALLAGVERYGTSHWKRILSRFSSVFGGRRRVVDLLSKYKLLQQDSSYYRTEKRDWISVDENNNPKTDMLGDIISISTRFPYDAAKKIAKKRIKQGEPSFVLRIREGDDLNHVHVYLAKRGLEGSLILKKMALGHSKE